MIPKFITITEVDINNNRITRTINTLLIGVITKNDNGTASIRLIGEDHTYFTEDDYYGILKLLQSK